MVTAVVMMTVMYTCKKNGPILHVNRPRKIVTHTHTHTHTQTSTHMAHHMYVPWPYQSQLFRHIDDTGHAVPTVEAAPMRGPGPLGKAVKKAQRKEARKKKEAKRKE